MDRNDAKPTGRVGATINRWLAGIAVGSLFAATVAPATGWIARRQIAMVLGMGDTPVGDSMRDLGVSGSQADRSAGRNDGILRDHPTDFPLHLAAAMESGQDARARAIPPAFVSLGDSIRTLESRFASEPGLYAAATRLDTQGVVQIRRPERSLLTGDPVQKNAVQRRSDPVRLATFDRDVATGERLEPDNAFFPMMRCVGRFAADRDKDAIASLERAARSGRWDEHLRDEVEGKWRLARLRTGNASAIETIAVAAAVLFPHYAQMRAASQLATLHAMELEKSGDAAGGARIRNAVMRVGDLMRSDATSLIGNLVGIADVNIAVARPGGAPAIKPKSGDLDKAETANKRFVALDDYWRRTNLRAELPLAKARYETGNSLREDIRRMAATSLFNQSSIARLVLLWCGGAVLLSNVLWLLVAAAISAVAQARRTAAYREPMPRSGPFVILAVGLVLLWFVGNAAVRQWTVVSGLARILAALSGMMEGTGLGNEPVPAAMALLLGVSGPALIGLGSVVVGVARRTPIRIGLSTGYTRIGLPLAAVVTLGFCGVCTATARWEHRVNDALEQTVRHEGRYLAILTGKEWPGPIE